MVALPLLIRRDDLHDPRIAVFLEEHIRDMRAVSPPESKHALDLEGLRQPDIRFWSAWDEGQLVGCGALKLLDHTHGELKSMRSAVSHRGRGVGRQMLLHILGEARATGLHRLSLETGAMPFFAPARALYAAHGFAACAPFGAYRADPNSVFMTLAL